MKTTKTYDTDQFKLVPIEPTLAMLDEGGRRLKESLPAQSVLEYQADSHTAWDGMLFAVPDTIPGVVEHSGEPAAYLSTDVLLWNCCRIKKQGSFTVPVFRHPSPTINQLAIVKAALEEAVGVVCWRVDDPLRAAVINHIRALDPQAILDSVKKS